MFPFRRQLRERELFGAVEYDLDLATLEGHVEKQKMVGAVPDMPESGTATCSRGLDLYREFSAVQTGSCVDPFLLWRNEFNVEELRSDGLAKIADQIAVEGKCSSESLVAAPEPVPGIQERRDLFRKAKDHFGNQEGSENVPSNERFPTGCLPAAISRSS